MMPIAAECAEAVAPCLRATPDMLVDRLTHLVTQRLQVPLAMVILAHRDGPAVLSVAGFENGLYTSSHLELCLNLIMAGEPVVIVPNTLTDPRFAASPVADRLDIRSYAALPVHDGADRILGMLCVCGYQPSSFDEGAVAIMRDIAKRVSAQLERVRIALDESQAHYRHAVEFSPQIPWIAGPDGMLQEVGPRWLSMIGAEPGMPIHETWRQAMHPGDWSRVVDEWADCLQSGRSYDRECRVRLADGSYRWFRVQATALRGEGGEIVRWYGTTEDVHDRKLTDLALAESEERLRLALEVGGLGAWEIDLDTNAVTCSPRCATDFGLQSVEDLGRVEQWLDAVHPTDRQEQGGALQHALQTRQNLQVEFRTIWSDGSLHWIRITGRGIYNDEGRPVRMVGLSLDVTEQRRAEDERQQAEARVSYLAYHDPLTGLANRRLLQDRLAEALRDGESSAALLCIDLDQFKAVNDTLGHEAGDRLLQETARRLGERLGPLGIVARYGGDEFAVLLTGGRSRHAIEQMAVELIEVLAAPVEIDGHTVVAAGSIGIALAPDHGMQAEALMRNADAALYRAKTDHRGGYRFFDSDMDSRLQARQMLKMGLRDAAIRNELRLHYQPLVQIATGRIIGFEALLRWQHPERGLLGPAEFIEIAEETGWIVQLGRWALFHACEEAMRWPGGLRVAVNLSVAQFNLGTVAADVAEALRASGLSPDRLELEVTETLLMRDNDSNTIILQALRRLGVRIALDDFGVGYSSLSYLRRFRFDKIKIDKSLVSDLPDSEGGDAIMQAIAKLGLNLGIGTTAEGIETWEQLALVRAHGCTEAQGFLFSRPVPAERISNLLNRWFCQVSRLERSLLHQVVA